MWTENTNQIRDCYAGDCDAFLDGDVDVDSLFHAQKRLVRLTHSYVSIVNRPEITDQPALEALCFLAVVENQIGLDDEILENCVSILGVSHKQLWSMVIILEQIYGGVEDDLLDFIVGFAKNLHRKAEIGIGDYNLYGN